MKRRILQPLVAAIAALTLHTLTGLVQAEDLPALDQKQFKGTILRIDQPNQIISVKGSLFWSTPIFNVGDQCLILLEDKKEAAFKDLRPGQRIQIRYRVLEGVKVANQITEKNPTFAGHISAIDPAQHTFKVKDGVVTKEFKADPHCAILGRENKPATIHDLKLGHRVTVTYLDLDSGKQATKIQQTSLVFSGTLEAIDVDARMLRAQHMLSEKKFSMASKCPIVVGQRTDGKLTDLGLGDKLVVHYEIMDGVMVANRIELEFKRTSSTSEQASKAEATSPAPAVAQP